MPDGPRWTMRFRRLSGAEIEMWRRVAETVTPRPGAALPEPAHAPPAPDRPARPPVSATASARAYPAASYTPPVSKPKPPPAGLERRFKRKVAAGRVPVEGVLDLHGLSQAEAHGALHRFILGSHRQGLRLVLVVTGKGARDRYAQREGATAAPGVLRRAVPSWLRDGALRPVVIGFEEAAVGHGGAGALYVRLRRPPDA